MKNPIISKTKICTVCNIRKNLNQFYKSVRGKYGVRSQCKICNIAYSQNYNKKHQHEKAIYKKTWCEINKESIKLYRKFWYKEHMDYAKIEAKKYYINNKEKIHNQHKLWIKKHPWYNHYLHARYRCNNPKSISYKYYGKQGIEFLLTLKDIKKLWFRDKAYLMKKPSLDRIKSKENYEFYNCQFLELKDNVIKMHKNKRKYINED